MASKPDWESIRRALAFRAGFQCEGCGLPFYPEPIYGFSASHRMPRSSGIKQEWMHGLANLALFCGQGNERDTCHGKCKDEFQLALDEGWVMSRYDERHPKDVPIKFWDGWYLLDEEGGKRKYEQPSASQR